MFKTIGIVIVVLIIIIFVWKQMLVDSLYALVWLYYMSAYGPNATSKTNPKLTEFTLR